MRVNREYADARVIESYTISGITRADMRKMTQVYDRVMGVIENHLDKSAEKKEYLSDDDLYDIVAILDILTENNKTCIETSVFDRCKEKLLKMHKEIVEASVDQPQEQPVIEEYKNF